MTVRSLASLVFVAGLGALLAAALMELSFGEPPLRAGGIVLSEGPERTGAANLVTSVVLAYRGLDTLVELTILFAAATAAGMVLPAGGPEAEGRRAGFVLRVAADLLFPFLVLLGAYLILHGHLTPGGGFQGGTVLAVAYFLPLLAHPQAVIGERATTWLEGLAGAAFLVIGLAGVAARGAFLAPLPGGELGELVSAGSLPLLYLALGIKVGSELAGLMGRLIRTGAAS
jgi:multicomponent Na+:H+ antiporter subunit B